MPQSKELLAQWNDPSPIWRDAPFWSWNDRLDPERLLRQIDAMRAAGMGGFFMHSRYGLKTVYLSEEWFRCVNACIEHARATGMKAYLYDEDRWPSGSAGGAVTRANPDFLGRRLERTDSDRTGNEERWLAGFAVQLDATGRLLAYRPLAQGESLRAGEQAEHYVEKRHPRTGWYNDGGYLDTLNPDAVAAYIASTHAPYAERYGKDFGGLIPAIFTDEPSMSWLYDDVSVHWTPALPREFTERRGYDIFAQLPELFRPLANDAFSKVRHDFRRTLTELFVENFTHQITRWCDTHKLPLTGHVLEEQTLASQCRTIGAAMPHYEHMQWPGVDILCNQSHELATVKQCTSVCDQLGKERTLSELYGGIGWDCSLETHKFVGDWQAACGINFRCVHLVHYSLAGGAKRDWPPSQLLHCSWGKYYRAVEDYFARLGYMLRQGTPVRDVLVLHPIETAWGMFTPFEEGHPSKVGPATRYFRLFDAIMFDLLKQHYDFDLADESLLAKYGSVEGGRVRVGQMVYRAIIVPPSLTLRSTTLKLLESFRAAGGILIFAGEVPAHVDGIASDAVTRLAAGTAQCAATGCVEAAEKVLPRRVSITENGAEQTCVRYMLRDVDGGRLLFVQSQDRAAGHRITVRTRGAAPAVAWDPMDGSRKVLPSRTEKEDIVLTLDLPPTGSMLLSLGSDVPGAAQVAADVPEGPALAIPGPYEIQLTDPNCLVLTQCEYAIGEAPYSQLVHVLDADARIREKYGLAARNIEGHQPWYLYALGKVDVTPRDSCRLRWTFHATTVPAVCRLATESPTSFEISVNGQRVAAVDGWWLDEDFKTLNIAPFLRAGENEIVYRFDYRPDMELEPIYIVGGFGVGLREPGLEHWRQENYTLTEAPTKLAAGDWLDQGLPYYGDGVKYAIDVDLVAGTSGVHVDLPQLACTAAAVHAGPDCIPLVWPPYQAFVPAETIRKASGRIWVEVLGGRKGVLGTMFSSNEPSRFGLLGAPTVRLVPGRYAGTMQSGNRRSRGSLRQNSTRQDPSGAT